MLELEANLSLLLLADLPVPRSAALITHTPIAPPSPKGRALASETHEVEQQHMKR